MIFKKEQFLILINFLQDKLRINDIWIESQCCGFQIGFPGIFENNPVAFRGAAVDNGNHILYRLIC